MRHLTPGRQRGFTLTELAVAGALALFMLSGVIFVFTASVEANTRALNTARLHHSLLSVTAVMRDELRRAGYWSGAAQTVVAGARNGFAPVHVAARQCVLFSYDRDKDDHDGRPDAGDQAGFRLTDGRIQTKTRDTSCGGSTCRSCDSGLWWAVTDPRSIVITGLRFDLTRSTPRPGQVAVRQLSVTITGRLRDAPALSRTLHTTVGIRNDELP